MPGLISFILDFIVPSVCIHCGKVISACQEPFGRVLPEGWPPPAVSFFDNDFSYNPFPWLKLSPRVLCGPCWLTLEPVPPGSNREGGVVTPFFTNDTLLEVVRFLKFRGGRGAVPQLAWWMAGALSLSAEDGGIDIDGSIVTEVPLHPSRRIRRGYNQAELLAREVASLLRLDYRRGILERRKNTKPQSTLPVQVRPGNMKNAFRAKKPRAIAGTNVILVDDLVTSGETAAACMKALFEEESSSVTLLAAGRARGARYRFQPTRRNGGEIPPENI